LSMKPLNEGKMFATEATVAEEEKLSKEI